MGFAERLRFFVREAIDDCVSCHTSLASPHDAPISKGFVDQVAFSGFVPRGRVRIALATRQFDEALALAEMALKDPSTPPHALTHWLSTI